MDEKVSNNREPLAYWVALYGLASLLLLMVIAMILYVACSKKYRLNWFERNLLESAETTQLRHSQEALVGGSSIVAIDDVTPSSSRGLRRTQSRDDSFWVPTTHKRQSSLGSEFSSETSLALPGSPSITTSAGENEDGASGGGDVVPIARSDKHVILASAPVRPKVSSMQTKLDHTKIDTSLYQKTPSRSPSPSEEPRGSLHIVLNFDPAAGLLSVRLIEAQDLQAHDVSGTADPYAKIWLLPDRSNVWQTRVHKRTLNPVFDEDFVFEVRTTLLPRSTLEVVIYDFDAYSRHLSIGGLKIALAQCDWSEKMDIWYPLVPCDERNSKVDLGELMISLAFLPSAGRLKVVIVKARGLRIVDDTRSSSDPFVKVTLTVDGKRGKKRKTAVQRGTVTPTFNEAVTFDVNREALTRASLEFLVLHDSLLGPSEPLGKAIVSDSSKCPPEHKAFFAEMLASKTATGRWLQLSEP